MLQSRNNENFKKVVRVIIDERNIRLAYREYKKRNQGSFTAGAWPKLSVILLNKMKSSEETAIRERLEDYKQQNTKGVEIPKPDGSSNSGIQSKTD